MLALLGYDLYSKKQVIWWYDIYKSERMACIKKSVSQSLFRSVMPTGYLIAYITHDQDKSILTYYPMVSV